MIVTVAEVFKKAEVNADGKAFEEKDFTIECPNCRKKPTLETCKTKLVKGNTIYYCAECGHKSVAVVGPESLEPMNGKSGYLLKDYAIKSWCDIYAKTPNMNQSVLLPSK